MTQSSEREELKKCIDEITSLQISPDDIDNHLVAFILQREKEIRCELENKYQDLLCKQGKEIREKTFREVLAMNKNGCYSCKTEREKLTRADERRKVAEEIKEAAIQLKIPADLVTADAFTRGYGYAMEDTIRHCDLIIEQLNEKEVDG